MNNNEEPIKIHLPKEVFDKLMKEKNIRMKKAIKKAKQELKKKENV